MPERGFGRFGLHADSTFWLLLARGCHPQSKKPLEGDEKNSSYKNKAL